MVCSKMFDTLYTLLLCWCGVLNLPRFYERKNQRYKWNRDYFWITVWMRSKSVFEEFSIRILQWYVADAMENPCAEFGDSVTCRWVGRGMGGFFLIRITESPLCRVVCVPRLSRRLPLTSSRSTTRSWLWTSTTTRECVLYHSGDIQIVDECADFPSKRMRNKIAGYVTVGSVTMC